VRVGGHAVDAPILSRVERVARIQRKRRLSLATMAIENALWLAGAAAMAAIAVAGITSLH
jgi:hypothetical protein